MIPSTPEYKADLAENMVCRWYSLVRHLPLSNPSTFECLRQNISCVLSSQGVEPLRARAMAADVVNGWITECDGLAVDNIVVFEVLEARLVQVL